MRRLILIALVLGAALAGFYGIWPAWSGRRLENALKAEDTATIARLIDFPAVRARAKPLVKAEIERSVDNLSRETGTLGQILAKQVKGGLSDTMADTALNNLLTPENVGRAVSKDFLRTLREIAAKSTGQPPPPESAPPKPAAGSETGQPAESKTSSETKPFRITLSNVKGYRITGPLSIAVDIAHDSNAAKPDLTVEMAFSGLDWRVVGLVPRLPAAPAGT